MRHSSFVQTVFVVLIVLAHRGGAQSNAPAQCGVGIPPNEQTGYVPLPRGDVFCPIVADPKSFHSFASLLRQESSGNAEELRIAAVGIGDEFGLGRWNGSRPGDGLQFGLTAGVFTQFDIKGSDDLLNADYIIGVPVSFRLGWFSTRLRVYHQSSHLGDGYLARETTDLEELEDISYEAFDWVVSVDAGFLRVYGGGERLFNRSPEGLGGHTLHGGAELRPGLRVIPMGSLGGFRLVAGGDLKSAENRAREPSVSARAGLEYDRAGSTDGTARRWGIFYEYYDGPSPYGQFFRDKVKLTGLGIHFNGL